MKSKAVNLKDFVETSGGSWNKPSFSSPAACLLILAIQYHVFLVYRHMERSWNVQDTVEHPWPFQKISPIRLYIPILLVTGASDTGDRLLKHPIVML